MVRYWLLLAAVMAVLVAGCASGPQREAKARLAENQRAMAAGDYAAVYDNLRYDPDMRRLDEIGLATRALLAAHPAFPVAVAEIVRRRAAALTLVPQFVAFASELGQAERLELITPVLAAEMREAMSRLAVEGLQAGWLKFTLADSYEPFAGLAVFEPTLLLDNSIEVLVSDRSPPPVLVQAVMSVARQAGKGKAAYGKVAAAIPRMHLSRSQLAGPVRAVFPAEAQKAIDARSLYLLLAGNDRLLQEDLAPRLAGASPWLVMLDAPRPGAVVVDLQKLQWDERQAPEKVQTIRYAMAQVTALPPPYRGPHFASYAYELTSGEASLEYAVDVRIHRAGQPDETSLLRDFIAAGYAHCDGQRLENPFGGAQPVPFIANAQMEGLCANPSGPVDVRSLRAAALDSIAASLLTAPAIASRL